MQNVCLFWVFPTSLMAIVYLGHVGHPKGEKPFGHPKGDVFWDGQSNGGVVLFMG